MFSCPSLLSPTSFPGLIFNSQGSGTHGGGGQGEPKGLKIKIEVAIPQGTREQWGHEREWAPSYHSATLGVGARGPLPSEPPKPWLQASADTLVLPSGPARGEAGPSPDRRFSAVRLSIPPPAAAASTDCFCLRGSARLPAARGRERSTRSRQLRSFHSVAGTELPPHLLMAW